MQVDRVHISVLFVFVFAHTHTEHTHTHTHIYEQIIYAAFVSGSDASKFGR